MQVANFECKLAQAQLQRYLAGAAMSPDALTALEEHLLECSDCQAMLSQVNQPEAPAPTPAPFPDSPVQAPVAQTAAEPRKELTLRIPSLRGLIESAVGKTPGKGKTLALTAALAVMLVLMSTIAKDPTRLLGERANDGTPRTVASSVTEKPDTTTQPVHSAIKLEEKQFAPKPAAAPKPVTAAEPIATPTPVKAIAKPMSKAKQAAKPRASVRKSAQRIQRKPTPRAAVRTRARPAPTRTTQRPTPNSGGITIYDAEGNKIR